MDLAEEVKVSFEKSKEEVTGETDGATGGVVMASDELAPGFLAMKEYYERQLLMITRRGYRQFAGSSMPTSGDELVLLTATKMTAPLVAVTLGAFTDGVMIGHQDDHRVKMCFHFNNVDHLFHDQGFRDSALKMAFGFAGDAGVTEYFQEYCAGAMAHMSHLTGFAHSTGVQPSKVWDLWLLVGTACITASYLAGTKMGTSWRERDALDGIVIATEEVSRGAEGEADSDL